MEWLRVVCQVTLALVFIGRMVIHDGQFFDGIMIQPAKSRRKHSCWLARMRKQEPAQERNTFCHTLLGHLNHGDLFSRGSAWSFSSATFMFMNSLTMGSSYLISGAGVIFVGVGDSGRRGASRARNAVTGSF